MQYRDYEIYTNNPTLESEDQDFYSRGSVYQLGLLTSLPPTAMFIINRARKYDMRRNVLQRMRDKEEKIRRGYGGFKDDTARVIAENAEHSDKRKEILREIDELISLQSDSNVPEDVLKMRIDNLSKRQAELFRDMDSEPFSVFVSEDSRRAARSRDIILNTAEHDWARALAGESGEEALERLEKTAILLERRSVSGGIHAPISKDDMTIAGKRYFRMLNKVLTRATSQKEGGPQKFSVEIVGVRNGLYDFKVNFHQALGHIKAGQSITLSAHQFLGEHLGIETGNFDGKLMDAFQARDGGMRRAVTQLQILDGKKVLRLHSDTMFEAGGSARNFLSYLYNALTKQDSYGRNRVLDKILSQSDQHITSVALTDALGQGNDSSYNRTRVIAQDKRFDPDVKAKSRMSASRQVDFTGRQVDDPYRIKARESRRFHGTPSEIYIHRNDGSKDILTNYVVSPKLSSASGYVEGTVELVSRADMLPGGSPYGQQPMRANVVTGASIDYLFNEAKQERIQRIIEGRASRKHSQKQPLTIGDDSPFSLDRARYDFVAAKRMALVQSEIANMHREASFNMEDTIVMLGKHEEELGVSMDQTKKLFRYGGNSFRDILNNPEIDMAEVHRTITQLHDHDVVYEPAGKSGVGRLTFSTKETSGARNAVESNHIINMIDQAKKQKRSYLIVTKKEAQLLGATVGLKRKLMRASNDESGIAKYILFFEERTKVDGIQDGRRTFKFFDEKNSMVAEENNKIGIKQTLQATSVEQVIELADKMDTSIAARNEFKRTVSTRKAVNIMGKSLIEKGFSVQTAEGAFRQVLSELLKDELYLDPNDVKNTGNVFGDYGLKNMVNIGNRYRAYVFGETERQKSVVKMANHLFANIVLGRELRKGENFINSVIVRRQKGASEISKVEFTYNSKGITAIDNKEIDNRLLKAFKDADIQHLKKMEGEIQKRLQEVGFRKTRAEGLLFSTGETRSEITGRFLSSVAVGTAKGGLGKDTINFLRIISGIGTPEGHQIHSLYTSSRLGQYLFSEGPKMNMYDIQSLTHFNPVMGKYYKDLQTASFKLNKMDSYYIAQMNRKLNSTAMQEQPLPVKEFREKLKAKAANEGLEELTWKTMKQINGIDSPDTAANKYHKVTNNPRDIINIVKKAHERGIEAANMQKFIEEELGLDEFYFDNKESIEKLKYFNAKNESVVGELFGIKNSNIKAINLYDSISLHTMSNGKGPAKSDFLLYEGIREGRLKQVPIEDLLKRIEQVDADQREKLLNMWRKRLSGSDSKYYMKMADDETAAVIRMEVANRNLKYLQQMEKDGKTSSSDFVHLKTAINAMKGIMEKSANALVSATEERGGFGKVGADFKIAPQFSANLKIERSDDFTGVLKNMDWKDVVVSKQHIQGMAKSSFIIGETAKSSLHNPDIQRYFNAVNKEKLSRFRDNLQYKGSPYESMLNDMFDEVDGAIDPSSNSSAESARSFARKKYLTFSKRLEKARILALDSHHNEADVKMMKEMRRQANLGHVEKYRSITGIRTLFSDEGLYGKIESQIKKSKRGADASNIFTDIMEILDEHKIRNNKKYTDVGRLWAGWQSIGERLQNKNDLKLIKNAIASSVDKNDKAGRKKANALISHLNRISSQYVKSEGMLLNQDYIREFGEVADTMMVVDDIGVGNKTARREFGAKAARRINPDQLSHHTKVLKNRAGKLTSEFMSSGMLLRTFENLISFDSDKEVFRLISPDMTDAEMDRLAENKINALIDLANRISSSTIHEGKKSAAAEHASSYINNFIKILGVDKDRTAFKTEILSAMKLFRAAGTTGISATGMANPDIFQEKHMQSLNLRMVLDKHVDMLDDNKYSKESKTTLKNALRNGKMKMNHVLAYIMDRDFDGDSVNIYASLMDERFGNKSGNLSASNVMSFMKNMSFSREGNRFMATNASSAIMSEMLFNESQGAATVVMETAYDAAKRRLEKEAKSVGYIDSKKTGGAFDMEAAMKDVVDKYAYANHLDKKATDAEKLAFMKSTYVVKNVIGLADDKVSTKRYIEVGGQRYEVDKTERERMGIDAFSRKVAKELGFGDFRGDRTAIDSMLATAEKFKKEGDAFLKKTEGIGYDLVDRALDVARASEIKNQTNFEVQKAATGQLYKYPTLMRMLGESVSSSAKSIEVRKAGEMMKNLAGLATYTMQQKVAIGMKKGGIDAVEGIDEFFGNLFEIADIQDPKLRDKKVKDLTNFIHEKGFRVRVSGSEQDFMHISGYAKFMGHTEVNPTIRFDEHLKLGYAKQKALEGIITGDNAAFNDYLKKTYGDKSSLSEFSGGVIKALKMRAEELHGSKLDNSVDTAKAVYRNMYLKQIEENQGLVKAHSDVIRFSQIGIHSMASLGAASKAVGEFQDFKSTMRIMGTEMKNTSHQVLLAENLRNIKDKAKGMSRHSVILHDFFSFLNTPEFSQANGMVDLMYSGSSGPKRKYISMAPKPQLIGANFGVKAAGIGLGILALGAFAPSPAVGKNSNSVVDKTDEYSAVLPDKMIAQYNNQATVSQINPWVTNRIKEERAESARFNSMFHKSFTG